MNNDKIIDMVMPLAKEAIGIDRNLPLDGIDYELRIYIGATIDKLRNSYGITYLEGESNLDYILLIKNMVEFEYDKKHNLEKPNRTRELKQIIDSDIQLQARFQLDYRDRKRIKEGK